MLSWFNSREVTQVGVALADEFASRAASDATTGSRQAASSSLEQLLRRADDEVRPLQLNFYKKAKFANSFKWRLIESGVAKDIADDVTQSLVLHLSQRPMSTSKQNSESAPIRPDRAKAHQLASRGNKFFQQGAYAEAAAVYEQALALDSSQAEVLNNLGASVSYLGRYEEAEQCFRGAIAIKPQFADAHGNLGVLLQQKSRLVESQAFLRHALKLRPNYHNARNHLGLSLVYLGRLREARACFTKVLKGAPRNDLALYGMGLIAAAEGRFDEAEATYRRIIEINPKMTNAWAALPLTRKMTAADGEWLKNAEVLATGEIDPMEEANLRFAIGKYYDDVNDFARAFQNFKRGNELLKAAAENYDRKERSHVIDESIRVYSKDAISKIGSPGSSSAKPVFVVGMPRSGTSLAEQILASHPTVYGAGELSYWADLVGKDIGLLTRDILSEPKRFEVAKEYLRVLEGFSASASRIVDKAPVNSDLIGLIYSVFPNARVIYMQRDPIDTCLSCYFQQFLTGINFTFDLSDLVHYYREHQRIMAHWRAVLPAGFILDVPYEQLVSDQETWSRKMLNFIGLEWDARCLEFHANSRQVSTASAWQVRQKIYKSSVTRWHNYEKFIGPLKTLGK
jgi:tetratricopeptide (TPR) repeat protein